MVEKKSDKESLLEVSKIRLAENLKLPSTVFEVISKKYRKNNHAYHNLKHVKNCLEELEGFKKSTDMNVDFDIVELAIWLHDVVYDPRATDNENKSAMFAEELLSSAGFAKPKIQNVKKLIQATDHKSLPKDVESAIIIDIDLAIFGKSKKIFDEYEKAIRNEYSFVPDDIFRKARKKVLYKFLKKEEIFNTEFFMQKYKNEAIKNLSNSIGEIDES